jgi:2-iminobutanoate/2-iminopropanoate deaminase
MCGSPVKTGQAIRPLKINYIRMKKIIKTSKAPAAIGPYSQAVETNGTLYISGQVPLNPETGRIVEGGITVQAQQIFKNIEAILAEAGYTFKDVVKSTCLLSDIKDFKAMNEVYEHVYSDNPPARSTYAVRDLPLGALLEIETIAVK